MIGMEKPSITTYDLSENGSYAKFEFAPLERGYACRDSLSIPSEVLFPLQAP